MRREEEGDYQIKIYNSRINKIVKVKAIDNSKEDNII